MAIEFLVQPLFVSCRGGWPCLQGCRFRRWVLSDHEIGLERFAANFVATDTLWLTVSAPMNIVTQRDVAILQSLRKRYRRLLSLMIAKRRSNFLKKRRILASVYSN